MNRFQANIQLLKIIEALIKENPELRFSQILQNYGFIKPNRPANPEVRVDWQNEFYTESEVVLERVKRTTANMKDE